MSITESATPKALGWTADDGAFGARLALIRQRMGWGNIALAAKECGVPTDSWRNWEVDGREPRRLTTIAMTIATRTGCDYLWLVHGPNRGGAIRSTPYVEPRVIATVGDERPLHSPDASPVRAVRQTRPIGGASLRPMTHPIR